MVTTLAAFGGGVVAQDMTVTRILLPPASSTLTATWLPHAPPPTARMFILSAVWPATTEPAAWADATKQRWPPLRKKPSTA